MIQYSYDSLPLRFLGFIKNNYSTEIILVHFILCQDRITGIQVSALLKPPEQDKEGNERRAEELHVDSDAHVEGRKEGR